MLFRSTNSLAVSSAGVAAANMSADADEPIIPVGYRRVLVLHAAREWYRDRGNDARSQEVGGEYEKLFARMAGDTTPDRDHARLKGSKGLYLAGAAGTSARRRRFQTGSEWDDFRV